MGKNGEKRNGIFRVVGFFEKAYFLFQFGNNDTLHKRSIRCTYTHVHTGKNGLNFSRV